MASNFLEYKLGVDTSASVAAINQFFATVDSGAAQAKSVLNSAFGQKFETTVDIQFKNGELVAKKIAAATTTSQKLQKVTKAVNGEFAKTPKALKEQVAILEQLRNKTAKYEQSGKGISKDWQLLTQKIKAAREELTLMTKGNAIQRLGSAVKGLGGQFAIVQTLSNGLTQALNAAAKAVIDFAKGMAEMEVAQLALKAFTGDTETAKQTFKDFAAIAVKTPFNLEQVSQGGKILLAFGLSTEEVKNSLEDLAIVAGATGGDLNNLARNLGQVKSQNRAFTRDLNQFAIAGIPIFDELAKVLGVSVVEVRELTEEGQIGFAAVEAALANMTAEGTAFANLADEINNTWVGLSEQLKTKFQEVQIAAVDIGNALDRAFGGGIKGAMRALVGVAGFLADNFDTVAKVTLFAVGALAGYNAGLLISAARFALVTAKTWLLVAAQKALAVIQAVVAGPAGWAQLALGIGIATAAVYTFDKALGATNETQNELKASAESYAQGVQLLTDREARRLVAGNQGAKKILQNYINEKNELDKLEKAKDLATQKLQIRITQYKALSDSIIDGYKEEKKELETKVRIEKAAIDQLKREEKQRHTGIMNDLDKQISKVREYYDAQRNDLNALTAEEKELQQIEIQKLRVKAEQGGLDREASLQAKVDLQRAERRLKLQELDQKQTAELTALEKQRTSEKQKHADITQSIADKEAGTIAPLLAQAAELDKSIAAQTAETKKFVSEIERSVEATNQTKTTLIDARQAILDAVPDAAKLTQEFADQRGEAVKMQSALLEAYKTMREMERVGTGGSNRFAGGPVSAGQKYTVNELGQEAFLSASGKLSKINAKSWGQWRAPSSGTVIPAHLTKQLDIPSSGININSAGRDAAVKRNSMGGNVSYTRSSVRGSSDNITNHITIQSGSPVQDASKLMLNVIKNRSRRRF